MNLRRALRSDVAGIGAIWADAFVADPFFRFIAPEDATYAAFAPEWMTFIAANCFERGHTFIATDDSCAIAWIPPDLGMLDEAGAHAAHDIIAKHTSAQRADDALATVGCARAKGMQESHWTLQYVGIRTALQGRGLGRALLAPGLALADAEGIPCALFSSNTRNVSFYEAHGFVVTGECPTPGGAAVFRPMQRAAR